jgi:hypothetical protein
VRQRFKRALGFEKIEEIAMAWPWGKGQSKNLGNRRARRAAKASSDSALLFEMLEPRVLLNASPVGLSHENNQGLAAVIAAASPPPVQLQVANLINLNAQTVHGKTLASVTPAPLAQNAEGTQLFATLTGPGQIQFTEGASGPQLTVTGTSSASTLTLTTKGGNGVFTLDGLTTTGPIGSILAGGVSLQGALTVGGAANQVQLGNVTNSTLSVSGAVQSLSLGDVQNSSLSVAGAIGSLTVGNWLTSGSEIAKSPQLPSALSSATVISTRR